MDHLEMQTYAYRWGRNSHKSTPSGSLTLGRWHRNLALGGGRANFFAEQGLAEHPCETCCYIFRIDISADDAIMLTIRDAQMQSFSAEHLERFLSHVAIEAHRCWPVFCDDPRDPAVVDWIRGRARTAQLLGWDSQGDILRYVNVAIALGEDFASDPRYPWIVALMRSPVQAREKLDRLCELAELELSECGGAPVSFVK